MWEQEEEGEENEQCKRLHKEEESFYFNLLMYIEFVVGTIQTPQIAKKKSNCPV